MTAPSDYAAFRHALERHRETLPKRLRQCAAYFENHPERVAFETVAQVAEASGVQPSAVIRFAKALDFSGYSELQNVFRARYSETWPDYQTRLARIRQERGGSAHDLLQQFAHAGERSLHEMVAGIAPEQIEKASESLFSASMIHIVGFRRAFPVAAYLAYAFEKQGRACRLIDGTGLLGTGAAFGTGHRLLAISFAPYTEQTLDLARHARTAGAEVVAISDTDDSPLFSLCNHRLQVEEEDVGEFRSLTATFALVTALAVAVGMLGAEGENNFIANR